MSNEVNSEELNKYFMEVLGKEIVAGTTRGILIYKADNDQEEILYVNNAILKLFNCKTLEEFKEYTGNSFKGMVHPDDLERVKESIKCQISNNDADRDYVEYRIISKGGRIHWLEDNGHLIHTDIIGDIFFVFLDDVTNKNTKIHEAVEKILSKKLDFERYERVVKTSNKYTYKYILEDDRLILYVPSTQDKNGIAHERVFENYTQRIEEGLVCPKEFAHLVIECLRNGEENSIRLQMYTTDGEIHWYIMTSSVLENDSENVITCGTFEDIEGIVRKEMTMQAKVKEYSQKLKKADVDRKNNKAMLTSFNRLYLSSFYADISRGKLSIINAMKNTYFYGLEGEYDYDSIISRYIEDCVYEDDQEKVKRMLGEEYIQKHLTDDNQFYSVNYRRKDGDDCKYYVMRVILSSRDILGNVEKIVMSTVDVTEDEKKENEYQRILEEKNQRITMALARESKYKNAILSDAMAIFEFNLTQDEMLGRPIQNIGKEEYSLLEAVGLEMPCKYSEFSEKWINHMACDESGMLVKFFSKEFLEKCFNRGELEPWIEYWTFDTQGRKAFVRQSFLLTKAELSEDIIAIAIMKDITDVKMKQEESNRQVEMIKGLTSEYVSVFFADFALDVVVPYRTSNRLRKLSHKEKHSYESFYEYMVEYVNNEVYEPDRETVLSVCSQEYIKHQLGMQQSFYINYRLKKEMSLEYYQLKFVNTSNSKHVSQIVIGFKSVEAEIRKEMEQKKLLEDALFQAQQANSAKSKFLSNMSHDIRTPMNAIVGFTSLALSNIKDEEKVVDYLKKIEASSDLLLNLINDVLDMSRIESGKDSLDERECNLAHVMRELYSIMGQQVKAKNHKLILDTKKVTDKMVYCDRLRLNQILINIINNAVKYTNPGGTIEVTVVERRAEIKGYATYEFKVKDTGIGIDKDFIEYVFEPFEREKNTTLSGVQGTGLGLAITKKIVDMMGGTIKVESEVGKGSTFTITLELRLLENQVEEEEEITVDENRKINHNEHILLVEDNELNSEIAEEILKEVGFKVDVAENGRIAVEKIKESKVGDYDLILMDIQMPEMNGYEATKRIREFDNKDLANIPIIAMTANAFDEDKKTAIESGMNGHISKPIDVVTLINTIEKFCGN